MTTRIVFDEAAMRELFDSPEGPIGKAITRATIRVQRRAKQLAPVDTGRLRASIQQEVGRDERGIVGRVGTNVKYAVHLEYGTRRMTPRPFLRPALSAANTTWTNQHGSGANSNFRIVDA